MEADELLGMFPGLSRGIIERVTRENEGNEEGIIEELLALSQNVVATNEDTRAPVGLREPKRISDFSDVILEAEDGGEVPCHRVILSCRSVYFAAVLESLQAPRIKVEGVSLRNLNYILDYLYTDQLGAPAEEHHALLSGAEILCLDRLRSLCESGDVPPSTYSQEIVSCLNQPTYSDVILLVEGMPIYCHKFILCSTCEYFKVMLCGPMKETKQKEISILDTTYPVMMFVLEYLYRDGDVSDIPAAMALEVFLAANKHMVQSLQDLSENMIQKKVLDDENACLILETATELSPRLKSICTDYIMQNYLTVRETRAFKELNEVIQGNIQSLWEEISEKALQSFFGSLNLHEKDEIVSSIKMEVASFLAEQLQNVEVASTEDTVESPIGIISYKLANLQMAPSQETIPQVEVELKPKAIEISVSNLTTAIPDFSWSYQQTGFPNMSGEGTATAIMVECCVMLHFQIISTGVESVPRLQVSNFDVKIGQFSLTVSSGKSSWIYNLITKLFSTKIKNMVQQQLMNVLGSSVATLTENINELGSKLGLKS